MSEAPAPATLLFVDDEAGILSSLRRLFRPQGYDILTAEGGAAGLAELEKTPVDLVISDMRMPEMDGAAFLKQVRQRWPDTIRILLTGYADVNSTVAAINDGEIYRYIAKPWDDNEIAMVVQKALEHGRLTKENKRLTVLTQAQNEELKTLNASLEQKVAERTAELEKANQQLKHGLMSTLRIFSGLIELRGGRLAGHGRRVAELARALAQALELSESEQQDVMLAGLLHDIGKISLPDNLLDQPFLGLSGEAKTRMMSHAVKGQQALTGVVQLANAAKIIRHHHECIDGSGYPDHLAGLAIPLGARILAVVNDFDALQMGTLSAKPHTAAQAVEFLMAGRGTRYTPAIVSAFVALLEEKQRAAAVEHELRPHQMRPGMMLSRDLIHPQGYTLMAQGSTLAQQGIDNLLLMEEAEAREIRVFIRNATPQGIVFKQNERPAAQRLYKELALRPAQLKEGMMLSRALNHQQGFLLLAKGYYLDEPVIKQLRDLQADDPAHPILVYIRVEDKK